MKRILIWLLGHTFTLFMLVAGLAGNVHGAFNIYKFVTWGQFILFTTFVWIAKTFFEENPGEAEKYTRYTRSVPQWVNSVVSIFEVLFLCWFGHFVLATVVVLTYFFTSVCFKAADSTARAWGE